MDIAIVYSSRTGNTEMLAEAIRAERTEDCCIYFGGPSPEALKAQRIYVGFWTDQGSCDGDIAAFLNTVTTQQIYLFGTAGFGGSPEYFDRVLKKVRENLPQNTEVIGTFMCQGKMPMTVRQRYEKMLHGAARVPNLQGLIENFDRALIHPDQDDLQALRKAVREEA